LAAAATANLVPSRSSINNASLMLQNFLAERFRLVLHREEKEVPIFELVIAKNGPKLKESAADPAAVEDGNLRPPALVPPRAADGCCRQHRGQ
jgi:uncharacterized protein (TIGR03435 family)